MARSTVPILLRDFHYPVDYAVTLSSMQRYTQNRDQTSSDQLMLLEHKPTYTLGLAGKPEHLIKKSSIPLIQSDRGGQITYHGPGQIMLYTLLDYQRLGLNLATLVASLEQTVIDLCADVGIKANANKQARGVYVNGAKLAAIGLKLSGPYCYHGLAINVDMDLAPFENINPCGYPNQAVIDLKRLGVCESIDTIKTMLVTCLFKQYEAQFTLNRQDIVHADSTTI